MNYATNTNTKWHHSPYGSRLLLHEFLQTITRKTGFQPRPSNQGYIGRCPAHNDKRSSLSIGEGNDGRILLYCHAGCSVKDICNALGITAKDLFPKRRP